MESKILTNNNQLEDLNQKIADLSHVIQLRENEINSLSIKLDEYDDEINTKNSEINKLHGIISEFDNNIFNLNKKLSEKDNQINLLNKDNDNVISELKQDFELKTEECKDKLLSFEEDIKCKNMEISNLTKIIDENELHTSNLISEKNNLNEKLSKQETDLDNLLKNNGLLNSKIDFLEKESLENKSIINALHEQIEVLNSIISEKDKTIDNLRS